MDPSRIRNCATRGPHTDAWTGSEGHVEYINDGEYETN